MQAEGKGKLSRQTIFNSIQLHFNFNNYCSSILKGLGSEGEREGEREIERGKEKKGECKVEVPEDRKARQVKVVVERILS